MTTTGSTSSSGSDDSTSELLRALSEDVRSLVQQELRNAQRELIEKARGAGKGVAMFGGAAVLGALSAGTSAVLLTRALDRFVPRTVSALLVTSLFGGAAAALAVAGAEELRRSAPIIPERTVEGLRDDVKAARDRAE